MYIKYVFLGLDKYLKRSFYDNLVTKFHEALPPDLQDGSEFLLQDILAEKPERMIGMADSVDDLRDYVKDTFRAVTKVVADSDIPIYLFVWADTTFDLSYRALKSQGGVVTQVSEGFVERNAKIPEEWKKLKQTFYKNQASEKEEREERTQTGHTNFSGGSDPDLETLGLKKGASWNEVKRAFKTLVFQNHPDRNPSLDATEKTAKLTAAYKRLERQFIGSTLREAIIEAFRQSRKV